MAWEDFFVNNTTFEEKLGTHVDYQISVSVCNILKIRQIEMKNFNYSHYLGRLRNNLTSTKETVGNIFKIHMGNELIYVFCQAFANIVATYYQDEKYKTLNNNQRIFLQRLIMLEIIKKLRLNIIELQVYSGYVRSVLAVTLTPTLKELGIDDVEIKWESILNVS